MGMAQIDFDKMGGSVYPDESASEVGLAYVNDYIYAINNNDPTSLRCGRLSSSDITYQMTLCDYTFNSTAERITVTAKANVKIRAISVEGSSYSSVDERTLSNGNTYAFTRPAGSIAQNTPVGVLLEVYAQ